MICGISVQLTKVYRIQNYVGWMLIVVGFGILTLLDVNTSRAQYIGFQIVLGVGLGVVWISTQFPILAPLPFSNNAHALAFFTFVRCFAQVHPLLQFYIFLLTLVANNHIYQELGNCHRRGRSPKFPSPTFAGKFYLSAACGYRSCLCCHSTNPGFTRASSKPGPRCFRDQHSAFVAGFDRNIWGRAAQCRFDGRNSHAKRCG